MSTLRGTINLTRFSVVNDGGALDLEALTKAIASRRFVPLRPEAETNESAGWAPFEAPYDDERVIDSPAFMFGERIALIYREDKWSIPRPLLKRETQKRLQKIIEEESKDPDEIGKAFVKAVEQAVLIELKQKSRPRSKVVEIEWTPGAQLRVFGRGTVATDRIASLFERTFTGTHVEQDHAPTRAFRLRPDGIERIAADACPFFSSGFAGTADEEG